jgi:hypothetical protein
MRASFERKVCVLEYIILKTLWLPKEIDFVGRIISRK